jgi:serine/threonine protein kinase
MEESQYPWEREALAFIRDRFPSHEPYRAWSNFEFIAEDGSVNEVDLLVFSPQGFFLIEIKSHPGRLTGDAGLWTFDHEGKRTTFDNPLLACNRKAKKLRSLLGRQSAARNKGQLPFIEGLVFCSAPDLTCQLQGVARTRVCLRDRPAEGNQPARDGIMAAITRRACEGLSGPPRGEHNRPMAKVVAQTLEQAGIRPRQRNRKVGDYILETLVDQGPGYQDWVATHTKLKTTKRLIRLYLVRTESSAEDRRAIERAARREFELLEALQHPGILRAYEFTEHELGPAIFFAYDPAALRLDHYIARNHASLGADQRVHLLRQVAEVIQFAHENKIVHRALSPRSILVIPTDAEHPRIRVFNWQVGHAASSATSSDSSRSLTAHIDRLVDDSSTAFMAPEVFSPVLNLGEHLDVFSLGALAYYLFSGEFPAENGLALSEKLRGTGGLKLSAVLNAAGRELQDLVQGSTNPDVSNRLDSVTDFLEYLDLAERELSPPEQEQVDNPSDAKQGDLLPGGYMVVKRLGQGSTSIAMLVERGGEHFVLKVASDIDYNQRLMDEAEVIPKLRHSCVVDFVAPLNVGEHAGFLVRPVFADKDKLRIETLGHRLRVEGSLHLDLLQRFGDDLIGAVSYLEEQGIPHRDIKPDNITVGMVGRGDKLHLVLFDFSLSRAPVEQIRAGTNGYLDPLLPLRKRWDLHAERYAVAVTLYELATGTQPIWGDGKSDPSHLTCEITLEPERFDSSLRDGFTTFFRKAFRRNVDERFDNADEMLNAWRDCFKAIEDVGAVATPEELAARRQRLDTATADTPIHELGLGARATNALDRVNVVVVGDLLQFNLRSLQRMRGVGNATRREITDATRALRKRLGSAAPEDSTISTSTFTEDDLPPIEDAATASVDQLAQRVLKTSAREQENSALVLHHLLGVHPNQRDPWPSQSDVAVAVSLTRARVGQLLTKFQTRWSKDPALTPLRADIAEVLEKAGGIMLATEVADAVIAIRGSVLDEPLRSAHALAVVRAAVEVERTLAEPRYGVRRVDHRVLLSTTPELADYAVRLGNRADQLAQEDPLAAPARALEQLRKLSLPERCEPLSDARLVRLAAIASQKAALSSRQEFYPRGMDAARVLKLASGVLYLAPRGNQPAVLTVEEIRERVQSRYPDAAPLPDRPKLDTLLAQSGFELHWHAEANEGRGGYMGPMAAPSSVTQGTDLQRYATRVVTTAPFETMPPEVADARQVEERLQRALKEGAFLALMVEPKHYLTAVEELCRRFPIEQIDMEALMLEALRDAAQQAKVSWDIVLQTDAVPGQGDWDKLLLLVRRAMPAVEARLRASKKTMLLVYPGLLARYGQMGLLESLRDSVGRKGGIPGLWLLLPGGDVPQIDGQAVPLIGPGQRTSLPKSWLENVHRAARERTTVG